MKPNTPQWMLRRFASRSLAIYARHREVDPVLAAFSHTIVHSANDFITRFDLRHAQLHTRAKERAEGRAAVAALLVRMRNWIALAAARMPDLDMSDYGDSPDVPDDVIADAERFVRAIEGRAKQQPETIPFAPALVADLQPAIATAHREWREADAANVEDGDFRAETREAARLFERDLVSFRTTLKNVLGSSHPDYQKLRRRRARERDRDDDEVSNELLEDHADGGGGEDDEEQE